ncbi:hypothetical protein CP532_3429 [Ophiocordyceps camponoti-leonardi (nom. inval.)]|nr:hypothetical protein CP532_3429 [Ophiocordyceps camponoti-leonardi (nom. inval.)]
MMFYKSISLSSTMASDHFKVLLFAGAGSHARKECEFLPAPMPLSRLFGELEALFPGIQAQILDSCMVTVNMEYVDVPRDGARIITAADEVAIIPPVSSG